ncbi:MAG: PAC2 family protein [Nitrosopumilus sp.]|nr:PAC2 family protein [Nitrosopumilus sp.]CAI9831435.1 conserved hypothetical protein [Nitrosopumilaceae archaeon]MDA7940832.1 PAC2 family protein [Nitrosopumilus sp.]MDA7943312.1 PAC2 family protein [Nitrosopumilus sp.]MDA7945775.1 PAC2 family protein [Nitrosopumilus sp.]
MRFEQESDPPVDKPVVIAGMQDMGNVGGVVIDFVNRSLGTAPFRRAVPDHPSHVIDRGGSIDVPDEGWEYRYGDGVIVFGGGRGQPEGAEMGELCRDVIGVAQSHSAKIIYTVGGFHAGSRAGAPRTYVTSTSGALAERLSGMGMRLTPGRSAITGFNGIMLGFAKNAGMDGIGLFGEIDRPDVVQYGAAASVVRTLGALTYMKIGDAGELESRMRG